MMYLCLIILNMMFMRWIDRLQINELIILNMMFTNLALKKV